MESTGKYWIPVYNILEHNCKVVLAHPKYVKAIREKKTDAKDAKWIADIFKHDLVSGSFIPPPQIRQLRDLVRYRSKLTAFVVGEKNRVQNCLTVSNIKLDDVFSDVFGKSASAITQQLLLHPQGDFDVTPFIDRRCNSTPEMVQAAVDGSLCPEQIAKLKIIRSHLDGIELCKSNLDSVILSLAEQFQPQLELLMSVPDLALKKRRGHKKAIIAICRMLLTAIYAILKKGEVYQPNLYKKEDTIPETQIFTVEQAISFVQRHGYFVMDSGGEVAS